jgi:uncharacterized membrane protein
MGSVEVGIDISAPAERVWRSLVDVESWPRWTSSITEVKRLDSGPLHVGSRARVKQPGVQPLVWEVTELDQGSHFTWVTRLPGVGMTASHDISETGDRTHLDLSLEFTGPLAGIVGVVFTKRTRQSLNQEANGHKAASEASRS